MRWAVIVVAVVVVLLAVVHGRRARSSPVTQTVRAIAVVVIAALVVVDTFVTGEPLLTLLDTALLAVVVLAVMYAIGFRGRGYRQ